MIGPTFQYIELPLMNHFMSQGVEQLLFRVGRPRGELFKEREREANFSTTVSQREGGEGLGPFAAGKHPN